MAVIFILYLLEILYRLASIFPPPVGRFFCLAITVGAPSVYNDSLFPQRRVHVLHVLHVLFGARCLDVLRVLHVR